MELQFRGIFIHDTYFEYSSNYEESLVNMGGGKMVKHIWIGGTEIKPDTLGMNTGLRDHLGNKIFEGDILLKWTECDKRKALKQVFWNKRNGAWAIDESIEQDKSISSPLAHELRQTRYDYVGNIHQSKGMLNYTCNDKKTR